MELKDLLELKSPTLGQFAEMEKQLIAIARKAHEDVDRLDAEDRARGADRLVGKDDGGEARAIARAEAEKRRSDAESVLSDVRARSAALEARLEKEADDRAWSEVRTLLSSRNQSMQEIETLCSRIGELYSKIIQDGLDARNKAPVKPDPTAIIYSHGHNPAQIGAAIMARVHISIDSPLARLAIDPNQFTETYCSTVARNGLPGFLAQIHNAILMNNA